MRSNQGNIERAMRAFDDTSDGFITIDDLKAVIDNFVMPTTDEVFQQLMHRYEIVTFFFFFLYGFNYFCYVLDLQFEELGRFRGNNL